MNETNRVENEKGQMRETLESLLENAKDVCENLQDQTAAAARATDRTVREHPYQAVGVAFGVGILIGFLVARSRRD